MCFLRTAVDGFDESPANGALEFGERVRAVARQAGDAATVGIAAVRDHSVGERREGRQGLLAGPGHENDGGTGVFETCR